MCNKNNCKHKPGYHEEYYKRYKKRMENDPLFAARQRANKQRYVYKKSKDSTFINKHNESTRKYYERKHGDPDYISPHQQKKILAYDVLGGKKCVKCGFSDIRALQVDHIFNNGNNEIKILGGTYALYKKIINMGDEAKTEYQILCANCNWIKRKPRDCVSGGRQIKCLNKNVND